MKSYLQLLSKHKITILLIYFLAAVLNMLLPVFQSGSVCTTDFGSNLIRARLMRDNIVRDFSLDGWSYMQYQGF